MRYCACGVTITIIHYIVRYLVQSQPVLLVAARYTKSCAVGEWNSRTSGAGGALACLTSVLNAKRQPR